MKIINSLFDTDLYKLTMMKTVYHQFPDAVVEYKFNCINGTALPSGSEAVNRQYINEIDKEIDHLCTLSFTDEVLLYLSGFDFFKSDFIHFLKTFRLNRNGIFIINDKEKLKIKIEGSWYQTILFEVSVLSIISELYGRYHNENSWESITKGKLRLNKKIDDPLYFKKKESLKIFLLWIWELEEGSAEGGMRKY